MSPDTARAALTTRIQELTRRTDAIEHHLRNEDGRLDADFGDRVAFTEADEVLEALDESGRAELTQLRAAIDRIDAGTWGTCLGCGASISPGRLEALPEAALCTHCATR